MVEMDRFKHKRLMCLDIGKKRIGIAVCDILHITTTPLTTIEVSSDFIKKIIHIIEKENPAAIIIGMPEASKGQVNSIVEFITECVVELQKYAIPEIIFHDESFSSKDAVSHMVHSGISKKKRAVKGRIDQTAAAIILRSFLDEYGL